MRVEARLCGIYEEIYATVGSEQITETAEYFKAINTVRIYLGTSENSRLP